MKTRSIPLKMEELARRRIVLPFQTLIRKWTIGRTGYMKYLHCVVIDIQNIFVVSHRRFVTYHTMME